MKSFIFTKKEVEQILLDHFSNLLSKQGRETTVLDISPEYEYNEHDLECTGFLVLYRDN